MKVSSSIGTALGGILAVGGSSFARGFTPLVGRSQPPPSLRQQQCGIEGGRRGPTTIIQPRTVSITESWNVTVWEFQKTSELVRQYWEDRISDNNQLLDPFGLVHWPGSILAVRELLRFPAIIQNRTVLILGAGVGVEAQAAAHLGATSVLATDAHPTTLELLQHGAKRSNYTTIISTQVVDITSSNVLPPSDVVIVADVLYNEELALHVIRRIAEARHRTILVSDSQRFVPSFAGNLSSALGYPVTWEPRSLDSFTGSGVIIDEPQTYSVKGQILWVNRDRKSLRASMEKH